MSVLVPFCGGHPSSSAPSSQSWTPSHANGLGMHLPLSHEISLSSHSVWSTIQMSGFMVFVKSINICERNFLIDLLKLFTCHVIIFFFASEKLQCVWISKWIYAKKNLLRKRFFLIYIKLLRKLRKQNRRKNRRKVFYFLIDLNDILIPEISV